MRFEQRLFISKEEAEQINRYLHVEPTCVEECLGEDITIIHTVKFDDGIEMDIKCCGVQYDEYSESNTAWTEAVLFENGYQVCYTDPSDEYLGEWSLEHDGNEYIVLIEKLITMEDWTDSFSQIATPGDLVEDAIIDEMINCVPPACLRSDCMQCGEPYSHREDPDTGKWRATYTTFKRFADGIYEYCGNCFCGENVERGKDPVYCF
jgi:hypothetical protein